MLHSIHKYVLCITTAIIEEGVMNLKEIGGKGRVGVRRGA